MKDNIRTVLETAIRDGIDLTVIAETLRQLKQAGADRDDVMVVLESMLNSCTSEQLDDRIREVMDVATGFCSDHLKVWRKG